MRLALKYVFFCIGVLGGSPAWSETFFEHARLSTVYISFDVTDSKTGAKMTIQGSGVVVSRLGYVLTASHLLRQWMAQSEEEKGQNPIKASIRDKPGFVTGSQLNLQVIISGDPATTDVALLKLPDADFHGYPVAPICLTPRREATMGDDFFAFGFPLNQNFTPVRGTLATKDAPGGRWAAVAEFAEGMSGGPVYDMLGNLIGLIKGGLGDTNAVRWITPIRYAENHLKLAGASQECNSKNAVFGPFVTKTKLVEKVLVRLIDRQSNTPISNASIRVTNAKGKVLACGHVDDGMFKFNFSSDDTVSVKQCP